MTNNNSSSTDPASMRGYMPRHGSLAWRRSVELLSSMRFAIALFTVICIASVVGTVMEQYRPTVIYVDQFGPFWAQLFLALRLNAVYSAWWFLLILAFLVISTSLCVARKAPKFLADVRKYKENIRERSLRVFHHRGEGFFAGQEPVVVAGKVQQTLQSLGWKVRLQERPRDQGVGVMVAAKKGGWTNKIGYVSAHTAIVMICLGGLVDGNLFTRAMSWMGGYSVYEGGGFISEIGPEHQLPPSNPTFRGNLLVPEGARANIAILNQAGGVFLQHLPFTVELKKFTIDYYPNGQPKLFASDIVIHDPKSGEAVEKRVEVNHPVSYAGIQIYQSDFDDGGSRVKVTALPVQGSRQSFQVEGTIGGEAHSITNGNEKLALEFTDLRVINVENLARPDTLEGHEQGAQSLGRFLHSRLGAADRSDSERDMRNVGPSIRYRLRDESGQAREFNNYMLPVDMGAGVPEFLFGQRDSESEAFRYLRVPADDQGSATGFMDLLQALHDPQQRQLAVQRYVQTAIGADRPELAAQLAESTGRVLELFASVPQGMPALQAISDFIGTAVPEDERERAAEVLLRILNGALFQLDGIAREQRGLPPLDESLDSTRAFMTQAVLALSDAPLYSAPVVFQLNDFDHVQASVFQVTRAPGKVVVYLGSLFLILGVFAMLYIRDRRLWMWLAPENGGSKALMAFTSDRRTLDIDKQFRELRAKLLGGAPPPGDTPQEEDQDT